MARKRTRIVKELTEAAEKLQQLKKLEEEAKQEEVKLVEDTRAKISQIANDAGFYCGVILTPDILADVVKMAATAKDNVKLPFHLYFNENEDD